MKSKIAGLMFLSLTATIFAANTNTLAIIPLPQKMARHAAAFKLTADTRIYVDSASRATGKFLTERLRPATGYPLKTSTKFFGGAAIPGGILLTTKNADMNLGSEGYELTIAPDLIVIRAPTQAGLFYGVQTLLQLLPPEIFSTNLMTNVDWQMPCVQIEDWPRFKWRGLMLDVARHFYSKPEVERILDAMALQKLNMFHWHLTDDQGWRIEIKKYPKFTQIGAWRADVGFGLDPKSTTAYGPDGRYGGFYTQADIREVVKYSAARHITIVPEIEMPGHSTAALAAYPQFGCSDESYSTEAALGIKGIESPINHGVYNPANPGTIKFLDGVLAEVFKLFPSRYIHIGGDEVPMGIWAKNPDCQALMKRDGLKDEQELQSWFTQRIEKFVNAHGKTLVGWSEITRGGLATNAVVMDWIGGGKGAAAAGHDAVMTPAEYCYLDHYQSTNHTTEPKAIGGYLPLHTVYSFEPIPENLPKQYEAHILGAQGNLWTEFVPNLNYAEYMIFPRESAIAEITWSSKSSRNWDDFMRRLRIHMQRLDELGINYRHASIETPESNQLK